MSHLYTPSAVAPPTNYTHPSDGDVINASSVNPSFEDLADAVKYLHEGGVASTIVERWMDPMPVHSGTSSYVVDGTVQQNSTGGFVYWGLELPEGCSFTEASVRIDPASGHTVFANINKPTLGILTLDPTTGTTTMLGTTEATDPSADITAYELNHAITKSGFSHTVTNSTLRYFARITLESGSDFQAGLKVLGVKIRFTVTVRDVGGS